MQQVLISFHMMYLCAMRSRSRKQVVFISLSQMQHTPENKTLLDWMTSQEKYDRTSFDSMSSRHDSISTYSFWTNSINFAIFDSEMPYQGTEDHKILRYYWWERSEKYQRFIDSILKAYESDWYDMWFKNPHQDCSVPSREHWHIIKR